MDKSQIIYDKLLAYMQTDKTLEEQGSITEQETSPSHIDGYLGEVCQNIAIMERTRSNYAYRELRSNRIVAPGIVFIKKCMRKCLKWYIEPICNQQTEFNNAVTPAMGRLTQSVTELYQSYLRQERQENKYDEVLRNLEEVKKTQNGQMKNFSDIKASSEQKIEVLKKKLEELTVQVETLRNINVNLDEKITSIYLRSEHFASRMDSQGARMDKYSEKNDELRMDLDEIKKYFTSTRCLEQKELDIEQKIIKLSNNIDENKTALADMQKNIMHQMAFIDTSFISKLQERIERLEETQNKKFNPWDKRTTSQAGEDSILLYLLPHLKRGYSECTYLDLGANHAIELSNTYSLYVRGARGVLVEANPCLIPELQEYRSGDIILNRCIYSETDETRSFYIMSGDGLSSMDLDAVRDMIHENPELKVESVLPVKTITVQDILRQYFGNEAPTVVNIDVEGMEWAILQNWDFEHYRPAMFVVEMIPYRPTLVIGEKNEEIVNFMESVNYVEYAFTGINSIFVDKEAF